MRGLLPSLLILLPLQSATGFDLPPQPDLDLPIVLEHYDPARPAPGPVPPTPTEGDPRDEPPPVFFGEEIPTESAAMVYVIDFSGSMNYGGRLDRAKRELERSVSSLSPAFEFNILIYDCTMTQWSPSLRRATSEAKAAAIAWVDGQFPQGGSTGTGPAVALALAEKANLAVVLLTDGDPNCGADGPAGHRRMIQSANTQKATITVFGIDAWGDYRRFCQDVAADSGGSYHDVVVAVSSGKL